MDATQTQINPESGWFGFSRVSPEEKVERVRDVFSSVAGKYDLMNDLMSLGLHRRWKDVLVGMMRPREGQDILDVGGGTGDVALRCATATDGKANITVCDINPDMLRYGREKAIDAGWLRGIEWIEGDAEKLPFAKRCKDTVCIAFALRNVTRIDDALSECVRVLRPGGRFFCLEFTPGVSPLIKRFYERYCFSVLPVLGEMVASDRGAYQYLAESIMRFPVQSELARRMERAGLEQVKWRDLMGGVAVIHSGWKL